MYLMLLKNPHVSEAIFVGLFTTEEDAHRSVRKYNVGESFHEMKRPTPFVEPKNTIKIYVCFGLAGIEIFKVHLRLPPSPPKEDAESVPEKEPESAQAIKDAYAYVGSGGDLVLKTGDWVQEI